MPRLDLFAAYLADHLFPALHWVSGFIVLAEGLNKLERIAARQPCTGLLGRFVLLLKAVAWFCLSLGAAGALARPWVVVPADGSFHFASYLVVDRVSLVDLLFVGGFALLIVRSRFKEYAK
jgi:hypothetical protein